MKLVIPTAGKGKRVRPFSLYTPKPLFPVAGKGLLLRTVEKALSWTDIEEIVLVISKDEHGLKIYHAIRDIFENTRYVYQEEPLGLGHAIYCALKSMEDTQVLIVLSDAIYDGKFSFEESFIAVKEVQDPRRFGVVVLDDEGRIRKLVEKPEQPISNLAIVGVYFLKSSDKLLQALEKIISEGVRTKGEFQLTDALQYLIESGMNMKALKTEIWWDFGKLEDILLNFKNVLENEYDKLSDVSGNVIIEPVYVGRDVRIENSIVGPFVSIEDGVLVRNSIVRGSIILSQATVENCTLEDSILGIGSFCRGFSGKLMLGDFSRLEGW